MEYISFRISKPFILLEEGQEITELLHVRHSLLEKKATILLPCEISTFLCPQMMVLKCDFFSSEKGMPYISFSNVRTNLQMYVASHWGHQWIWMWPLPPSNDWRHRSFMPSRCRACYISLSLRMGTYWTHKSDRCVSWHTCQIRFSVQIFVWDSFVLRWFILSLILYGVEKQSMLPKGSTKRERMVRGW